jgi:Divergent InlB B-repeat domain
VQYRGRLALLTALTVGLGLQVTATAGATITIGNHSASVESTAYDLLSADPRDEDKKSNGGQFPFTASTSSVFDGDAGSGSAHSTIDADLLMSDGQLGGVRSTSDSDAMFVDGAEEHVNAAGSSLLIIGFTTDAPVAFALKGSLSASATGEDHRFTCAFAHLKLEGDAVVADYAAAAPVDDQCFDFPGVTKAKNFTTSGNLAPGDYSLVVDTGANAAAANSQVGFGGNSADHYDFVLLLDPTKLTVKRAGNGTGSVTSDPGGISCGADCSEQYAGGTKVTLHATPSGDSRFTGWSGGGCAGAIPACTVDMDASRSVTAIFSRAHQPDGRIKLAGDKILGDNVLNLTGESQTQTKSSKRKHSKTFKLQFQNDGLVSDKIGVKGCGNTKGFKVHYLKGKTDVTSKVVGGTYRTAALAKGAFEGLKLKISVGKSAAVGAAKSCAVTATSAGAPTRKDVVVGRVKVAAG